MTRGNSNPKGRRIRTAIRKAAMKLGKWGGAVVTALLLVVWISSAWWDGRVEWLAPSHWLDLSVGGGCFHLSFGDLDSGMSHSTLNVETDVHTWSGWRSLWGQWRIYRTWIPRGSAGICPIWPVVVIVLAGTSRVWWVDSRPMRRSKKGLCAACGYDLVGTAADVPCPECGRAEQS